MRSPRFILTLLGSILAVGATSLQCARMPQPPAEASGAAGSPLLSAAVPAPEPAALHAVLINGGGWHEINYRSHRQHLEMLVELLARAGVDPANVTIFSSDGTDPTPDLAIREGEDVPDLWLLPRAGLGEHLEAPIEYVSTELGGAELRPAKPAELERWFREEGSRLRAGDTLLLYVTDHGNKNEADTSDNTISLWGGEHIGVRALAQHLDRLDPQVRVVMLMSQCFGGSFAHAIFAPGGEETALRGNVCGYFATTAERPAYGCYPENTGKEGVGHSQEILAAWGQLGELQRAHRRTLITDRTPDVPNTSRDFYLARLMEREAAKAGESTAAFVDRWLAQAWKRKKVWEPELRLLDHVAHSFGLFSPRTLAELDRAELPQLSAQLDTYADRWDQALDAARAENWRRFVARYGEWEARVAPDALRKLQPRERAALRDELLASVRSFTRDDRETWERLHALRRKAEDARDARYRTEVRVGAVLRMRTLLTSIAGRSWLEHGGSPAQVEDHERLARCETLALAPPRVDVALLESPEPLPQLADDRKLIESVMPSWMGIRYQPLREATRAQRDLPRGAVQVVSVYPDSPAQQAGMRVADVVVGTPGAPFEELHAIREWTMQSDLGRPTTLELLRGDQTIEITLIPGSFPLQLPALPGPPKVGSAAPALDLEPYRGSALASGGPRLLFFWATWCGPCKQSVPELLAFAEERGVPIVAITDEPPEQLDQFFRDLHGRFPDTVASDPMRASFLSYGVSGTPTFVLVDEQGVIRHYQRGYSAGQGLSIDGWKYLGAGG